MTTPATFVWAERATQVSDAMHDGTAVLQDVTGSMGTAKQAIALQVLEQLGIPKVTRTKIKFGGDDGVGSRTNLIGTVMEVADKDDYVRVVVLTDGLHNEGGGKYPNTFPALGCNTPWDWLAKHCKNYSKLRMVVIGIGEGAKKTCEAAAEQPNTELVVLAGAGGRHSSQVANALGRLMADDESGKVARCKFKGAVLYTEPAGAGTVSLGDEVVLSRTEEALDATDYGFVCPITWEIFNDPVLTVDGHSYERASIEAWFDAGNTTSPLTNAALESTLLFPNINLRISIATWRKERAGAAMGAAATTETGEGGGPAADRPADRGRGRGGGRQRAALEVPRRRVWLRNRGRSCNRSKSQDAGCGRATAVPCGAQERLRPRPRR